jgi:hypothetical protein
MGVTKWAIAGHTRSYSPPHMDASGMYTYVKMIIGEKYWFIGIPPSDRTTQFKLSNGPWHGLQWQCVHLRRGDQLIMPPGTPHYVITTKDSFAVGGHFYNYEGMFYTMHAMVAEHYFGHIWSNTDHPSVPIVLFKMVDDVLFRLKEKRLGNLCKFLLALSYLIYLY